MTTLCQETIPFSFVCTSGELLWGQLHTLKYGHENDRYDYPGDASQDFNFRVQAKKGKWNVSECRFSSLNKSDRVDEDDVCLYIVYHENYSMEDIIKKISRD